MNTITNLLGIPLGALIELCYRFLHSYGWAIVFFTFLSKIILLPVAIWTQKNSIVMVKIMPEINRLKIRYFGDKDRVADETQLLYKRDHYHPLASSIPMIIQLILLMGVVGAVNSLLGSSDSILTAIPAQKGGATLLMPVAAALAALVLTLAQNKINPLQREQSKAEQFATGAFSIAISLFLGAFVSLGTGIYWISSNLFTIPQQWLLNLIVKPAKYIDYEELEASRKELAAMTELGNAVAKEDKKREKADFKAFFKIANKHLVFYSEKSGYYKYFQNIIEYLLENSNVVIRYVTNDPKDQVFEIAKKYPNLRPYYIGEKKAITLFMKMDADMVIMTTPELENLYLKRSYVRKDVEYVYTLHGLTSHHMCSNKGAFDHYDTIFVAGPQHIDELRETEELYGLPPRNLVPVGYGLLDNLIESYEQMPKEEHERKRILIGPSWQEDNIMDSCLDTLVEQLYSPEHQVIVRPHPEYVKRYPARMDVIRERFKDLDPELFVLETDFSSNMSTYTSDLVITDWSGIAYEFAFTTLKPVMLINTPMKVLNPDYVKYKNVPTDITWRSEVGAALDLNELDRAGETARELLANKEYYAEKIGAMRQRCVYNIGSSGQAGAEYIVERLSQINKNKMNKQKERRK